MSHPLDRWMTMWGEGPLKAVYSAKWLNWINYAAKIWLRRELRIYRKIYLNQWKRVAGQCKQNVGHDNYINGPPIKISLIKVGGDFSLLRGGQVTQRSFSAPLERLWGNLWTWILRRALVSLSSLVCLTNNVIIEDCANIGPSSPCTGKYSTNSVLIYMN